MTDAGRRDGGLDGRREYPLAAAPLDTPGYREKYWACGYDPDAGVGFSIWLETTAENYEVWQESLHVVLPDGVLLSSTETLRASADGPGGQHGSGTCVSPFERWRYKVRSAMERVTPDQLVSRSETRPWRPAGDTVDVALDLEMISTAPAWNLSAAAGAAASETAFATQYRQLFRAEGDLRVGETLRQPIRATGFRAHSSGPYHGTTFGGHSMISVQFPNGQAAGYLQHVRPDGSAIVSQAFVIDDGALQRAEVVETQPTLPRLSPGGDRFQVRLRTPARDYLVEVEVLVNVSSVRPNYFSSTARTEEDRAQLATLSEGLANAISYARFRMDGQTGFGVVERSSRTGMLAA